MTIKYILGNWKMNTGRAQAVVLAKAIADFAAPANARIAIFPPFTALGLVEKELESSPVALGGQDCSFEPDGAFTGDISAAMLKDAGCRYVILGHSERRTLHQESDALVKSKAEAALKAGLTPVVCVGESLKQRESGDYLAIITAQVKQSIPIQGEYLVAYEPVWAIGTGKTPTLAQISEVHKTIASVLHSATSGALAPIVYGGSVKAVNAREILASDGVDGVLVGGASLNRDEFCAIIAAAH